MTDNPVAEIIARQCCFQLQSAECVLGHKGEPGCFDEGSDCRHWREYLDWAHAIIAALEGAGKKIMDREPTAEMADAIVALNSHPYRVPGFYENWCAAFDASPSWARNEQAVPETKNPAAG